MPQLIVNADDFGSSARVNEGILYAHHNGIVTSTSAMMNYPDARPGLEKALVEAPNLSLGLHLNLTHGRPVLPNEQVPSLVDDNGYFFPPERLIEVALQFDGDELYQEIAAQLGAFIAATGREPTHLDSHYHIAFMHPLALQATLTLAAEHRLPVRETSFNDSPDVMAKKVQAFMPYLSEAFIEQLSVMLREVLAHSPEPYMPAYFEPRFREERRTLGDLLNILSDTRFRPNRPTELLCHPGLDNDSQLDEGEIRQKEVDLLTHPTTKEVIESLNIELISYADLPYPDEEREGDT
jgi:predicted glycoside hydrolase/deacetylase ChbG (UPF0249 family)